MAKTAASGFGPNTWAPRAVEKAMSEAANRGLTAPRCGRRVNRAKAGGDLGRLHRPPGGRGGVVDPGFEELETIELDVLEPDPLRAGGRELITDVASGDGVNIHHKVIENTPMIGCISTHESAESDP